MYEFHGWATIRDSAGCEDYDDDPASTTIEAVRALAKDAAALGHAVFDVRCANIEWHVWMAGLHNHRATYVEDFFRQVAEIAPGSYGVLYVHDDEDTQFADVWRCHVMTRGVVRTEDDRYLSPHIGIVEDDCTDYPYTS